jgi:conjugal transfer pilus assembly protein TraV
VCSAPRGTCAPSTTIDDSAIHAIDAEAEAKDAHARWRAAANGSQASTNPKEKKAWTFVGPARPVLKIVYLPWRDGSGRLHPRTTGFVPIDAPQLAEASSAPLDAKAMGAGQDMSLLTLAEMAPDMALMAPAPAKAGTRQASGAAHGSDGGDQGTGEGDPEPAQAGRGPHQSRSGQGW